MPAQDPNTQVGACIVNDERRIVAIGYNGFPRGCSDDLLPWARTAASGSALETKYLYVVHAEANAVLNKNSATVAGCTLYVTMFPCAECAKLLIQSGIREVVFVQHKYRDEPTFQASQRMLEMAGIVLRQFAPSRASITVDFAALLGAA